MDTINKSQNIYTIVSEYPKVKDIMAELGFSDILKPGMLQSMGRFMTLEKGARLKGLNMINIEETFQFHGYRLV